MGSSTKVTTVIENQTEQGLNLKVGNRHYYAKLSSVKRGGEYQMQIDINWTYQEFLLEGKSDAGKSVFINSDDCCDYERITIKESNGKIDAHRVPRKHFAASSFLGGGSATETAPKKGKISWKFWL